MICVTAAVRVRNATVLMVAAMYAVMMTPVGARSAVGKGDTTMPDSDDCDTMKPWNVIIPWPPHQRPKPVVDNRMVRCVLGDYTDCPAKTPDACICYQYQRVPDKDFGNMYEREYRAKYGVDD